MYRFVLTLSAALILLGVITPAKADDKKPIAPSKSPPKHTNRLARETSPYLLQHAHNPVDWYPWGPEAFAKAKKEGKLIFLSIGYSSCYWCHVMERESFENEEVAKLLNDWFVCIKVDREERPDIDNVYMTTLSSALGRRGGWPLSMFLTAEAKPIDGGTYWPREDKKYENGTARGFKSLLKVVHDLHTTQREGLHRQADRHAELTAAALSKVAQSKEPVALERSLTDGAYDVLKQIHDKEYGGFGSPARNFQGTKFPTPPNLNLLLYQIKPVKDDAASQMLQTTLEQMARGGIYDQLGGGFHRYSTERTWTVPHFEKMLYDNAQLLEVYAREYLHTRNPLYRRILKETIGFVAREMTAPEGGFYSALDAETDAEEGRYYVWTEGELKAALPADANLELARKVYGMGEKPNFEEKYHILTRRNPRAEGIVGAGEPDKNLEARVERIRRELLDARGKRPPPFRDTKILTAWNGEMIAGLAAAGEALGDDKAIAAAERAATFVLEHLRAPGGRLLRTYGIAPGKEVGEARLTGFLDDYAFFVHGLLALHAVTKKQEWLDNAKRMTDLMIQHYHDDTAGGFFFTANDQEKLFARAKDQHDGAQPSGNSVAALNLVRLWAKTREERYRTLAEKTLYAFAPVLRSEPASMTTMAVALGLYLDALEKK